MAYEQFEVEYTNKVHTQAALQADNTALRALAAHVGVELPPEIWVVVKTSRKDSPPHLLRSTDGSGQRRNSPLRRYWLAEAAAHSLELVVPRVTSAALTRELARQLYYSPLLSKRGAKRLARSKARGSFVTTAGSALTIGEGEIFLLGKYHVGWVPVILGTVALTILAASANNMYYSWRQRRVPQLPEGVAHPIQAK